MSQPTYTPAGTEPLIDRLRRAVIGRYDVYAELGHGGMASVYLALDLALDRKVAIKVMSPALMNSPDNLERFRREAKVAAALNHPHIIGVYAVGDDPELAYFVMKYVEGRALDSVIRDEGAQSVPFVQTVISSAGKALHYAHTRGVIHRDVKPANFMIDQDGWLVVADFGIAKQGEAKGLTVTGSIIGTPYYMAPEQFSAKPVTGAADQYALGVVAYELLTGVHPFPGETIAEVMRGALFDPVPSVRALRPDVPAELDAVIARMMAKEPGERFPTLEDAVIAVGSISATQEVAVRTQIIELAKIGAAQQPQMSVPLSPVPVQRTKANTLPAASLETSVEKPSGSKVPLLVGGLALLAAVGGGGFWMTSRNATEPVAATTAPVDSAAIRDSMARAVGKDSAARADSIARADSVARAVAVADSVARADSIARAATARPATTRSASTRSSAVVNGEAPVTTPTRAPAAAPTTAAPARTAPARTTTTPTQPAPTRAGPSKDGTGRPTTRRP